MMLIQKRQSPCGGRLVTLKLWNESLQSIIKLCAWPLSCIPADIVTQLAEAVH